MLNEREKQECEKILGLLSNEDVFDLVKTLTKNAIEVKQRSEAERAILAFSESAKELLNRKKITKDILLNYSFNVSMQVSPNASKADLVDSIITHWKQAPTNNSALNSQRISEKVSVFDSPRQHYDSAADNFVVSNGASWHPQINIIQNILTYNQTINLSSGTSQANADQSNAEAFVKWFYEMLNSYHPAMREPTENFGPQHFWDDSQLYLLMYSSGSKEEENLVGSVDIVQRLLAFPQHSQILFNPNINIQGVTVRPSPHGAKVILVCGTIHKASECLGIFQQSFALVSSPLSPGQWKVKVMCLKMDQCITSALPRLEDCQEITAIEAHTTKALQQSSPFSST